MSSVKPSDSRQAEARVDDQLCPKATVRLRQRVYQALELGLPGDRLGRLADISLLTLIALNVAAVLAESMEPLRERFFEAFVTFELVSVAIFTLEYLARVWVCIEQPRFGAIRSNWLKRLRYMTTPMALVDIAAVLPFYLVTFGVLGGVDMRFLRALRLARSLKLSRHSDAMSLLLRVLRENGRNFAAALGILLIVMIITASGMHLFEHAAQPEDFGSIPAAMWWAFATLTTVGYGDVIPVTVGGKVFGALITVVSLGVVALPAGILASSFSERLRLKARSYRELADRAQADGVVTADEHVELEAERRNLGLGEDLANAILEERPARPISEAECPRCGYGLATPDRASRRRAGG